MKRNNNGKYRLMCIISALGLIGSSIVAMANTATLFDMLMPAVRVAHEFGGSIGWEWVWSGPAMMVWFSAAAALGCCFVLVYASRKLDLAFDNIIDVEPIS